MKIKCHFSEEIKHAGIDNRNVQIEINYGDTIENIKLHISLHFDWIDPSKIDLYVDNKKLLDNMKFDFSQIENKIFTIK